MDDFDSLLTEIGSFGRYQIFCLILCAIANLPVGMQNLANIYLQGSPDHWCLVPELVNLSLADQQAIAAPPGGSLNNTDKSCRINDLDYAAAYTDYQNNQTVSKNVSTVPCEHWVYDKSTFGNTAVTKWDLVCSKEMYPESAQTMYMLGVFLGPILFTHLSDRFGRKISLCLALNGIVVFGVTSAFAPHYWSHVMLRLLTGMCVLSAGIIAYVLAAEVMGRETRAISVLTAQIAFMVGFMFLAFVAFICRDFVWTNLVISMAPALTIPYWCIMPESPRWLLTQGRYIEATTELKKAAEINQTDVNVDSLVQKIAASDEKEQSDTSGSKRRFTFMDLFRTPVLRKRTINMMFNSFVCAGVYYGISLVYSNLVYDVYLNQIVFGAIEMSLGFIVFFAIQKFGRRLCLITMLLTSGLALIAGSLIPSGHYVITTILILVGRVNIAGPFMMWVIYCPELFPTPIRSVAIGAWCSAGHFGAMLSALAMDLERIWISLPVLLFGVFTLTAGVLSFMFPETLGTKLPDTIEEVEAVTLNKDYLKNKEEDVGSLSEFDALLGKSSSV